MFLCKEKENVPYFGLVCSKEQHCDGSSVILASVLFALLKLGCAQHAKRTTPVAAVMAVVAVMAVAAATAMVTLLLEPLGTNIWPGKSSTSSLKRHNRKSSLSITVS